MKLYNYLFAFLISAFLFHGVNGTAQVTITSSDSLGCTTTCTTLTAHLIGDLPTDALITVDDVYSIVHPIGFSFKFYSNIYSSLLIGANGTLCFDTTLATAYDPWPITAVLLGNASKFNNICGPWCDIFVPAGGTITYSTDGVAPNRKFAVTWCHTAMFSCTSEWITTQIIIYETTNIAEVHIAHHTSCAWNSGNAIVGVQNATGTAATVAPGRDYPSTWTATDEAWRFTPDTSYTSYTVASIPYAPVPYAASVLRWYDAGTGAFLGSGDTLRVCPTVSTTYKVGAIGCDADTTWGYYTVTPSPFLSISLTTTDPTQCGACDGTITVHGLTAGLSDTIHYDRAGVPQPPFIATVSGGGTITITGLCADVYSNIIATQGVCSSLPAGPVTLSDPPIAISSVTTANPTRCGVCDGILVLHGLYPSHTFTVNYNFNGAPAAPVTGTTSGAGTFTLTGLCAGVYDNIVASFGSCITPPVGAYTLTDPPISISSVTTTDATACGVCDGKLVLHGLYPGHVFTINYRFNGVPQTPVLTTSSGTGTVTLTGLCAGIYDNIIASYSSCVTPPVGPYTVNAPAAPIFNVVGSTSPSQCGYCDGTIILRAVPPSSVDTIYYSRNGIPQSPAVVVALPDSSLHMIGMCAGNYTGFTVKVGPCLSPVLGTATLSDPPLIASFTDAIHYGCNGDTVFYTNASTSTGALYYTWKFGDGSTDSAKDPMHIFAPGVYTVTLIATNHFCSDSAKIKDSLLHPLNAIFTATPDILCQGAPVTYTDASIGTGLSYHWLFGNGDVAYSQNPVYTFNNTGVYTTQLIITDFVPCSASATAVIQVDSLSPLSLGLSDSVLCKSTYVTFLGDYTTIGNTGITWDFGDGDSIKNLNPVSHAYDAVGTFTVSATAHFRACRDTTVSRVVKLYPAPSVYLGPDTTICPGSESLILRDANNATNALAKWKWNTGQTTSAITVTAPGNYIVKVTIDGCDATDSIWVANDCYMNIPNVFSPNGDGMNDYFYPRQYLTKGLTSFKMSIYNRWGQLLFETTSLNGSGWDGKFNDVDQPEGVYVYVIDARFHDGQKEHHQGNITLIR